MYIHIQTCVYIHIRVYVYIHIYIYIYTYTLYIYNTTCLTQEQLHFIDQAFDSMDKKKTGILEIDEVEDRHDNYDVRYYTIIWYDIQSFTIRCHNIVYYVMLWHTILYYIILDEAHRDPGDRRGRRHRYTCWVIISISSRISIVIIIVCQ